MRNTTSARYRATPALRRRIREEGRLAEWLAARVGMSDSQFSRIVSGQRRIDEVDARVLAALLNSDIGVLFELPSGISNMTSGSNKREAVST